MVPPTTAISSKAGRKDNNNDIDSDSSTSNSDSIGGLQATDQVELDVIDVIVEGNELGDLEDEVTVNISDQHYTLYEGGLRDVHFDANISTDEAQGIIDDIQRNILSIDQRNSCVFVTKQSNDTFTYGIVESISRDGDGTRVRIRICADGSFKMIQLNTDYVQRYIRRPYSPTKMRSPILTCLSMSQGEVAAEAPNDRGVAPSSRP
jgi:hypothetical protein